MALASQDYNLLIIVPGLHSSSCKIESTPHSCLSVLIFLAVYVSDQKGQLCLINAALALWYLTLQSVFSSSIESLPLALQSAGDTEWELCRHSLP